MNRQVKWKLPDGRTLRDGQLLTDQIIVEEKNTGQPFLRWAGSKKQLLPILSQYYSDCYKRYIEPFAGSACLFFRLQPSSAILGDINSELVSTYRQVKHRLPEVFPFLRQLKKGKKRYLKMRDSDLTRLSPAARAARFIYLNRFCFNGIYRTNLEGKFNVPYGGTKSGKLPSDEVLADCSRLLKRAKLIAGDFEEVLRHVQPRDFVYLDPPFLVGSRRVFREYNGAVFSTNDLKRLRSWLLRLDRLSVAFLLSYAECREAHALAIGFYKRRVTVNRSIAGFADTRRTARELLISNISPCKWRMNNHGN